MKMKHLQMKKAVLKLKQAGAISDNWSQVSSKIGCSLDNALFIKY